MAFNERTLMVMGQEVYNKIVSKHIVIVGVGGVGGAVFECLVRFGIQRITIIDFDTVDHTNLNRQIISTTDAVGKIKVDVAKERGLAINPDCRIDTFNMFIEKDNLHIIKDLQWNSPEQLHTSPLIQKTQRWKPKYVDHQSL